MKLEPCLFDVFGDSRLSLLWAIFGSSDKRANSDERLTSCLYDSPEGFIKLENNEAQNPPLIGFEASPIRKYLYTCRWSNIFWQLVAKVLTSEACFRVHTCTSEVLPKIEQLLPGGWGKKFPIPNAKPTWPGLHGTHIPSRTQDQACCSKEYVHMFQLASSSSLRRVLARESYLTHDWQKYNGLGYRYSWLLRRHAWDVL